MARNIFVARHKIVNKSGQVYGYELLFRDSPEGIKNFPSNKQATSDVIMNTLTHMNIDDVVPSSKKAFINIDHEMIVSSVLDILSPKKFVLEILENTQIDEKTYKKIKRLHSLGYRLALDDFDCSSKMINQFNAIMKYLSVVKIDVRASDVKKIKPMLHQFRGMKIATLAEKVETQEEMHQYIKMGFDLFQGYFIEKPEVVTSKSYKDLEKLIVLRLVQIIKNDGETSDIEKYLKAKPDLAVNLIRFLNNTKEFQEPIRSIAQVITLLGRSNLLRWLLIFLYSEIDGSETSKLLLELAIKRAEHLAKQAGTLKVHKDSAYMTGMFSALDRIFDMPLDEVFKGLKIDPAITLAILDGTGPLGIELSKAKANEKLELAKQIAEHALNLDTLDMALTLKKAKLL